MKKIIFLLTYIFFSNYSYSEIAFNSSINSIKIDTNFHLRLVIIDEKYIYGVSFQDYNTGKISMRNNPEEKNDKDTISDIEKQIIFSKHHKFIKLAKLIQRKIPSYPCSFPRFDPAILDPAEKGEMKFMVFFIGKKGNEFIVYSETIKSFDSFKDEWQFRKEDKKSIKDLSKELKSKRFYKKLVRKMRRIIKSIKKELGLDLIGER